MSKTHKYEPIRIKGEDIPKARKNWGKVKPFTRVKQDKKKSDQRTECRNFKNEWRNYE